MLSFQEIMYQIVADNLYEVAKKMAYDCKFKDAEYDELLTDINKHWINNHLKSLVKTPTRNSITRLEILQQFVNLKQLDYGIETEDIISYLNDFLMDGTYQSALLFQVESRSENLFPETHNNGEGLLHV